MEAKFNGEMVSHMSMEKQHLLKHKFTIDCQGHIMHGQVFYREVVTPKINDYEFGKAKTYFYMERKGAKVYSSAESFLKSLGLAIGKKSHK